MFTYFKRNFCSHDKSSKHVEYCTNIDAIVDKFEKWQKICLYKIIFMLKNVKLII